MTNSLVVGGAGFVGSWVVENLLTETDGEIFIVDSLLSSEKSNISSNSRVHFIRRVILFVNRYRDSNCHAECQFLDWNILIRSVFEI